ncbi:MAG: CDP-glycerol glycerophosphotransferase family protein [Lachnospiraceae bacterium]|nr:CDP-glycerol glycerophosphotransferase family protein [Lachnospiraceae bacterium]
MVENVKNLIRASMVRAGAAIQPNKNIWIFSSVDNRKFNYNSRYLFEYVKEHLSEIHPRYVINDREEREKLKNQYGEEYFIESETKEGIRQVLEGGVWFTSAGLPVYGPGLLKNRIIVNLWHGVPLKKIALMENQSSILQRLYFKWIFSGNYSDILTTSDQLIPIMAESFGVEREKIKVWGQPRNDLLFQRKDREELIRELYGTKMAIQHLILYAPTYREFGGTVLFPFDDMDYEVLTDFLKRNQIMLLIRYHLEEQDNQCLEGEWIRTVNEDKAADIMEVLSAFDMVITDYSSIYIDFLLMERPLLFLPYDKEEYLKKRGMNFSYDEVTPGPKPATMKDFMKEMKKLLEDSSYYQEERHRMNGFFNQIQRPCAGIICEKIKKEMRNET